MAELFSYEIYTGTKEELINIIIANIQKNRVMSILSMNTLKLYLGNKDEYNKDIYKSFTHIIQDGQSIVFANRIINGIKSEAISGAELMVDLIGIAETRNYRIFFLGSSQELLEKVKEKIRVFFPGLNNSAEYYNGYYDTRDEESLIMKIASFNPDLLFIAFGSPRKENFVFKYKNRLNAKVMMGVGGSYEYFVGDVKLDKTTKKLGLRWLIRTVHDPIRLGRRYLLCNTFYLYLLFKEVMKKALMR